MFNGYTRSQCLQEVSQKEYDLLIIGGGITGAGVARDAASRGLKVLLVEAQDFASGTSSRSSKLVHGGIRYLENFEFGLVHEALTERKHLLRMAPHLVHPLRFMIPIYNSSRVGLFKMEAGMILYDLLSFFEAPQIHEMHLRKQTERKEPLLKPEGLVGSVIYSDAYMEDDRLVIETLRSAQRMGAQSVNYVKAIQITEVEDGMICDLRDELTMQKHQVKCKHVVSCVGPWTDLLAQNLLTYWKPVLRPTKGVHLVFQRQRLPVQQAIVMAVEERIVFVIPREDIVIVGTTDTDFPQDPSSVTVESPDVQYLLEVTNKYFPELKLEPVDIISCYSGVRPLVKDNSGTEGKTSREHEIFEYSSRMTLVAGGKYTTYRAMAEQIVDSVLRAWSFEQRMALRAPNTLAPLNPSATAEKIARLETTAQSISEETGLSETVVRYLVRRRGEEAWTVFNLMQLQSENLEDTKLWMAEAKFCIENEMCLNLIDFYWRRSPLFLFRQGNGVDFLDSVARVFAQAYGMSETELSLQKEAVLVQINKEKHALQSPEV